MQMYEVGGCIRDEILGLKSKDIDFTVVLDPDELFIGGTDFGGPMDPFRKMVRNLERMGFTIWLESPEFLTARAMFPKGHKNGGLTADFVLARKERGYSDGRRPDEVEVGTLHDDLARRDFTMNAIAKDRDGNLIDPFNGQADIADRLIRAVGFAEDRLGEDALRGLRAIRFAVQKGFRIDREIQDVLGSWKFHEALTSVSTERIREEMEKAFKVDTFDTLGWLNQFDLTRVLFLDTGLRLMPTMKG
jgi:tRNA nucleotidyltransferase (CCA-adding enzyme)